MDPCTYAVIPDGAEEPAAIFLDLEHAIEWGLTTFGQDRFAIRKVTKRVTSPVLLN